MQWDTKAWNFQSSGLKGERSTQVQWKAIQLNHVPDPSQEKWRLPVKGTSQEKIK